jgi:hypothetical protein
VTRYIYEAKLLPIGEPVSVPVDEEGTPRSETSTFGERPSRLSAQRRRSPKSGSTTTEPYESGGS